MKKKASSTRLYGILARKSPMAVVFRRGPSQCVQLLSWNTETDSVTPGQWFKGRIYERRCDLAPDGQLLLYFAAKYKAPLRSWSAISRPPFLTALALWPKGDGWGGGGHFISQKEIALNHRDEEMKLANDFHLPKWMKVKQHGAGGRGEDDPVYAQRLERDGWILVSSPTKTKDDYGVKVLWEFDPPFRFHKRNPELKNISLEMRILGIKEREGPWYVTEYSVFMGEEQRDNLGRTDWADWACNGNLLFAQSGCLYRLQVKNGHLDDLENAITVADLSGHKFEEIESPASARRWPVQDQQKSSSRKR